MRPQARTNDICTRFAMLIRAFAQDRDAVSVLPGVSATGKPMVRVIIGWRDRHLFGPGSRVTRSLRVLLDCIGDQQGLSYTLEIDGKTVEPGRADTFVRSYTPSLILPARAAVLKG